MLQQRSKNVVFCKSGNWKGRGYSVYRSQSMNWIEIAILKFYIKNKTIEKGEFLQKAGNAFN